MSEFKKCEHKVCSFSKPLRNTTVIRGRIKVRYGYPKMYENPQVKDVDHKIGKG